MTFDYPHWSVPEIWHGETVFIIGGGPSLVDFNWEPLRCMNVIGCNDAYTLGDWVNVCYFGDEGWIRAHQDLIEFQDFPGLKVTCAPNPPSYECLRQDVKWVKRQAIGIQMVPHKIAWNYNTGASAINLAIKFGAKRVILLGFDGQLRQDTDGAYHNNWHPNNIDVPNPDSFPLHMKGFVAIHEQLKKYPDVEILNAGPDSVIDLFPMVELEEVLCVGTR